MSQDPIKSSEIIKFYREGRIIFSVEDVMSNKLDKKMYKIGFKLIPIDKDNKSNKEEVLTHYMDVTDAKRLIFYVLSDKGFSRFYNNKEKISGREYPCYKDLKGGRLNNEIRSRILTFMEIDNSYYIQLTIHPGKVHGKGAIVPIAGPLKKLFIRLSIEEMEQLAIELRDYIQQKEIIQFQQYHRA